MSIYNLKPRFQALLRPIVTLLIRCKLTPNKITLFALFSSCVMGAVIACYPENTMVFFILPGFLLFRMGLSALSGMMAHEHDMRSNLGVYLNEIGDIISDTVLYLPFALVAGFSPLLIVLIVIMSILTEAAGIIACQIGASRRSDGPCGKSDRAFIFGFLALCIAFNTPILAYLEDIQWIIITLLFATFFNRIKKALKEAA